MNSQSSPVYFTRDTSPAGISRVFAPIQALLHGRVGVKTHFGERGNRYYLRPELIRDLVTTLGATLIETRVLYTGSRHTVEGHIEVAREHGYDFAPIEILDAEGETVVPHSGTHYSQVRLGSGVEHYDSFLLISHFKGHVLSGFGGAIKNAGMGFASRAGKMAMHASKIPHISGKRCVRCGKCVGKCPGQAITLEPVCIDAKRCLGCGACIGVCPQGVFDVPWDSTRPDVFQERLVEYADAVRRFRDTVCINVLANISALCDCADNAPAPFVADIGIMASTDMLAIDQASLDLVNRACGSEDAFLAHSHVSGSSQLSHAERIGMGNRRYALIDLDR